MGRIDFDDLHGRRHYWRWRAYAQSKLANLLFAYELQRRLEKKKVDVISVACHPGYAATELQFGSQIDFEVTQDGKTLLRHVIPSSLTQRADRLRSQIVAVRRPIEDQGIKLDPWEMPSE